VVLMAALLIIPAATARFWTYRLGVMLVLSAVFGALMGATGTMMSSRFAALPAGPAIVLAGSVLFLISLFIAPRHGLIARAWNEWLFRRRVAEQRTLIVLYNVLEHSHPEILSFAMDDLLRRKSWTFRELQSSLDRLTREGCLTVLLEGRYALTELGVQRTAQAARAYRLWELFLSEHADAAGNIADLDNQTIDDRLPPAMIAELEEKLKASGRLPARSASDGS
jgi:manganese/zinc/iron transport system permease protein